MRRRARTGLHAARLFAASAACLLLLPIRMAPADFIRLLDSLTVGLEVAIRKLTALADAEVMHAGEIAAALENRINRAVPSQKLYAFYVLDSICKNISNPYSVLLAPKVASLFIRNYTLVDDSVRQKLINLFTLWRDTRTALGSAVFPPGTLDPIENFVLKATRPELLCSVTLLVALIDEMVPVVRARLLHSPHDSKLTTQLEGLTDIRKLLLGTQLPTKALAQIQDRLNVFRDEIRLAGVRLPQGAPAAMRLPQGAPATMRLPPGAGGSSYRPPEPQLAGHIHPARAALLQRSAPPQRQSNAHLALAQLMLSGVVGGASAASNHGALPPKHAAPPALPSLDLLRSLVHAAPAGTAAESAPAGAATAESSGAAASVGGISLLSLQLLLPGGSKVAPGEALERELVYTQVAADAAAFIDSKENYAHFNGLLYGLLRAKKCDTCGRRFNLNNAVEQAYYETHLDWHFRVQRKMLETSGRVVLNRVWYVDDAAWTRFRDYEEILEFNPVLHLRNGAAPAAAAVQEPRIPPPQDVVIKPGEETTVVCLVCKDTLLGVYNDDTGEWVWKAAVRVRHNGADSIYHHQCYQDMLREQNAKRAGGELGGDVKRERVA